MTNIRALYHGAPPNFSAVEQHPDAVRYGPITVGALTYFVDAIGGEPTVDEIATMLAPPVPTISKAQCLLWLLQQGKTEADVETAVSAIADPATRSVADIEWKYRQPFRHDHPLFAQLAPALGIDPATLPDAFRAAAQL